MVLLDVTVANITMKVNTIDPRDQATIVQTRTLGVGGAGGGYQAFGFGFGNPVASGGTDIYYFISLGFTGAGANATINQFPGLWGSVR
jgi:hypothetical protein